MAKAVAKDLQKFPAIRVHQWLPEWDSFPWDEATLRRKPPENFYVFSMGANLLRRLCGVYRRSAHERSSGAREPNTQRRHEPERSKEIARYIRRGFPWSTLSQTKQKSTQFDNLQKPGWLPTALVVNILTQNEAREGRSIRESDCLVVEDAVQQGLAWLQLPAGVESADWKAPSLPPIEVIDGQHRLLAFDEPELAPLEESYQFPVVAFVGLDRSWQAYLFYTINIKPKKINSSLAFDLYPLLRTEDWLERIDGAVVYRETRAQELVDLLFRTAESPWHDRINMLGETGKAGRFVSQSSWVRALLESVLRPKTPRRKLGGIFAARIEAIGKTLEWTLSQHAAVLIKTGDALRKAVEAVDTAWTKALRAEKPGADWEGLDLAYYGPNTLLNQDQGIRAVFLVVNDILYSAADTLSLEDWAEESTTSVTTSEQVAESMQSLEETALGPFIDSLAGDLAEFDWRSSSAPGLTPDERLKRSAFRGSSGYKLLRTTLLEHLKSHGRDSKKYARQLLASEAS